MTTGGLVQQVALELERGGIDLRALALGWAKALPTVAAVPAFGLRAVPGPARALIGLALAATVAPALRGAEATARSVWLLDLLAAFAAGLPVAVSAAVPLWAATMAGGVVDAVRGANESVTMPVVEGRPTPMGVPTALLASAIFLFTGGPARVAGALAQAHLAPGPLAAAAFDLAAGIQIAVAVAAPVLAASVVLEVGAALIARAASPAQVHALLAPVRAVAILGVAAIALDRMTRVLAAVVQASP